MLQGEGEGRFLSACSQAQPAALIAPHSPRSAAPTSSPKASRERPGGRRTRPLSVLHPRPTFLRPMVLAETLGSVRACALARLPVLSEISSCCRPRDWATLGAMAVRLAGFLMLLGLAARGQCLRARAAPPVGVARASAPCSPPRSPQGPRRHVPGR